MNSFYPQELQQHSLAIQPESAASSAQISHVNGLIVSEDDQDRPDLQQQRAQGNVLHEDRIFPRIVRRLSRARWFCLIRRIFYYQNGRERSDVRLNPLNSGAWICFEVVMVLAQIVSALVILVLSRHEKPVSPLRLWVVGYAFGCCVSLPLLYWRYKHPCLHNSHPDPNTNTRRLNFSSASSHVRPHDYAGRTAGTDPATINSSNGGVINGESRISLFMERCRMSLDFFFAVWFVIGNVWVFGTRREFAENAPSLYRLCIALLALSCIGYALPFILFAVLCCCMPCISTLLGYDMSSQAKERGASTYDIASLPTHRFKSMSDVKRKKEQITDSDQENDPNYVGGGYIILDTAGRKRSVSAEDAECCICLTRYKDNELLKELPCTHLFHVGCVDQWLKINSSCPLCKRQLNGSMIMADHTSSASRYEIFS